MLPGLAEVSAHFSLAPSLLSAQNVMGYCRVEQSTCAGMRSVICGTARRIAKALPSASGRRSTAHGHLHCLAWVSIRPRLPCASPPSQEPCVQQRLGPGGVRVVSSQLQAFQRCHSLCCDRETKCGRWEITGTSV